MNLEDQKVAVTSISFGKSSTLREKLLHIFPNSVFNEHGEKLHDKSLVKFISDADAAIVGVEAIDNYLLEHAPNLKIISTYGVGLDNIDQ